MSINVANKTLSIIELLFENNNSYFQEECGPEFNNPFEISYSDRPNLLFYALLFSAQDQSKAWNPSTSSFETYYNDRHSDFVLYLSESRDRSGWYTYAICDSLNIPKVNGKCYFIEIWQQLNASPNRALDFNTGNLEVCHESTSCCDVAEEVWAYQDRTLTEFPPVKEAPSPQEIWNYETRTLTSEPFTCDFSELEKNILAAITISTGKTIEELSEVNSELGSSIQKTFDLLKDCCSTKPTGTPTVQNPRIGPRGSKGKDSNMRFG